VRRIVAFVLAASVLAACSGGSAPDGDTGANGGEATDPVRTAPPGGALVRFDDGPTAAVEIADSREERIFGLMGRRELGPDDGMLFVFEAAQSTGFWMKNTLIPLSIAYMKRTGERPGPVRIVAIKEMTPCEADPCPSYRPGTAYDMALEMNAGWFGRHGLDVGDIATEVAAP
jgi:uncharacterized membrane protein (UPF0127 family)